MKRFFKILGIVIVILIVIAIALPFFIDANMFRPRLETDLTQALGRQVKVGNLSLSLLSGGVSADDISIADDPAYSRNPFISAKSLKVGVEMIPLIFSRTLNVTDLTLAQPEISLIKSENGAKWNFSSLGGKNPSAPRPAEQPSSRKPSSSGGASPSSNSPSSESSSNPNLSVAKLNVKDGRLTVSQLGSGEKSHIYDKVEIEVDNFSFASAFPFKMTANLPGGGKLNLTGKTGPIDSTDAARTPLEAKISVQQMNLAESGFIDPASGISGVADLNGTVQSNGHEAKTNGTLKATNLKVSPKGSPAGRPVEVTYTIVHNLVAQTGDITQGDVAMGKAIAHLTGTYDLRGKVTSVNLKLNGQNMPVDDLEAMLPAVGVVLPPKSQLKGGTLNVNMASSGPVDKLVTTGNVRMENSALAGFDLGSKLSAISALSGKNTGNDTTIQNFSSDVRSAPDGTQASNINLTVPSIGVLTGGGAVSPSNELAFKMNAAVAGLNVPFAVQGTTSDPKFIPDVKGMASGFLKNALENKGNSNQQNPLNGITGLFKKK